MIPEVKKYKLEIFLFAFAKNDGILFHYTENHIFFFQTSWKDSLSKKIALEYDLSCIIGKDDIPFYRKYDLTILPQTENEKWSFSKKLHGNIFFLNVLKRWSFQKGSRWHMIFLVLSGNVVLFPPKHGIFSLDRK